MKQQPNILFILVDALRARNLSCYGYPRSTSPNIDNLAREGVLFEKAFSCAVNTHPSLTTIFSGNYPATHGVLKHFQPTTAFRQSVKTLGEKGTVFLPEILRSEGYATLAVDWLGKWHKRGYDYYSGIEVPKKLKLYGSIRELAQLKPIQRTKSMLDNAVFFQGVMARFNAPIFRKAKTVAKQNAEIVTNKAVNAIERANRKPFFLFIHYWDTHAPYNPPSQYLEKFAGSDYGNQERIKEILDQFPPKTARFMQEFIPPEVRSAKEVLARYDAEIAYVDHEIGRLTKTLRDDGILDETFIIVTSDHGESLTEHGIYFGHHGLYDVTVHVPLIFKYSEFPKGERIGSLVQHTDVTPTIMDMLGLQSKSPMTDGKSLLPLIRKETNRLRDAVLMEEADFERKRAIRTENFKYIIALSKENASCRLCGRVHGGEEEFYDLCNDPEETNNFFEKNTSEMQALKKELFEWTKLLKSRGKGEIPQRTKVLEESDEEEKLISERLKELGYF